MELEYTAESYLSSIQNLQINADNYLIYLRLFVGQKKIGVADLEYELPYSLISGITIASESYLNSATPKIVSCYAFKIVL